MKALMVLFILATSFSAVAQAIHFTHEELVDMMAESAAEGACTKNFSNCAGVTVAICTEDVIKSVRQGACSKQIPAEGAGMDAIGEVTANIVSCVVPAFMSKYKKSVQKNASTPACQSFSK